MRDEVRRHYRGTNYALLSEVGGSAVDASTTVKGSTMLSVPPASATDPIAVGDNDSRVTPILADSWYGTDPVTVYPMGHSLMFVSNTNPGWPALDAYMISTIRTVNASSVARAIQVAFRCVSSNRTYQRWWNAGLTAWSAWVETSPVVPIVLFDGGTTLATSTVGTVGRWLATSSLAGTLTEVRGILTTASSSGSVTAVVTLNGTTSQGTLTFTAGSTTSNILTPNNAIAAGDYITVHVTGAGTGASLLTVVGEIMRAA